MVASEKRLHVLIGMREGKARESLMVLIRAGSAADCEAMRELEELEAGASCLLPDVIVLSEEILHEDVPLGEAAKRVAVFAPVVVVASAERQPELAGLVVSREADVVTLAADFESMAAAVVDRRLNSPDRFSREFRSAWTADVPSDFAEVLRHEINNPLTGILGNAELLLSQLRGKLPAVSLQRLETVIDLAVRLRETVRCLAAEPSNRETNVHSL